MMSSVGVGRRFALLQAFRHRCLPPALGAPARFKSSKPEDEKKIVEKTAEDVKTYSTDRVSKNLTANPEKILAPEKFRDDTDLPMKDPKKDKLGVDEMYARYMELKDPVRTHFLTQIELFSLGPKLNTKLGPHTTTTTTTHHHTPHKLLGHFQAC